MRRGNITWGLMLILAAVFIIFSQFGWLGDVNIATVIIGAFLGVTLVNGIICKKIDESIFASILLYAIFDTSLGLPDLDFWPGLLIAILLSAGLHMIFPRQKVITDWGYDMNHGFEQKDSDNVVFGEDTSYTNGESIVNCSVSFGSSVKYINSSYFERANLRCSFGELKAYFDNVTPANGNCTADIDVSFGDVKLYVPRTWRVKNNVRLGLAGVKEFGTCQAVESGNCLYIEGNASFGGIEIYYI